MAHGRICPVLKNPVHFVFPNIPDDVRKALAFAVEHGLRPTVYSSGHDYIGMSMSLFSNLFDL